MKHKKIKVSFTWATGTDDHIFVPRPLLGNIVKVLSDDTRLFHIRVDGMKYNEYISMYGGMRLDLRDTF